MTASLRPSIAGGRTGAAAVASIAMDGQSIGSKPVAAAVTHNSDSQ